MIGWFHLKCTKVEYLVPSAAGPFFFFLFFLLFLLFCQGFCGALTGLSGSLLSQSCVGKQNYLSPHCRVPSSPPDPASVKASGKAPA